MAEKAKICYNVLMPSTHLTTAHRIFRTLTLLTGASLVALVVFGVSSGGMESLQAIIVRPQQPALPWKVVEPIDVERGTTIPASTQVIFQLPATSSPISRQVLFGQAGKSTRYWGYCLPQNYDPAIVKTRSGLPGQVFLSESERISRAAAARAKARGTTFTLFNPPQNPDDLTPPEPLRNIKHQIEIFDPTMLCYLMTEKPLAMGLDSDSDGLNDALEREIGTLVSDDDTDGDGINDGTEFLGGTSPALRDTDADGLIDGVEDMNWNGIVNIGESDPRAKDSDRDGLCDGLCRVKVNRTDVYMGEDQNLNGKRDPNESDPLKDMSCKKGTNDYIHFVNCLQSGKTECPESCNQ